MMQKENPRVSVIIPCYNLGRYVNETIVSVLAQTLRGIEVIVVDDGSTDAETIAVLDALRYPNVRMIRTKNQGLSSARNTGVGAARGEYVCCLDADDLLNPRYLEKACAVLNGDAKKKLAFVTPWAELFEESKGIWETSGYDPTALAMNNVVAVASVFRKSAWKEVGGYAVNMKEGYEDWDFWIALAARGYEWRVISEPLFRYRVRTGSMITKSRLVHTMLYNRMMKNHREFFRRQIPKIVERIEVKISRQKTGKDFLALVKHGIREVRNNGLRSFGARFLGFVKKRQLISDTRIVIGEWYARRKRGEKTVYQKQVCQNGKNVSVAYIIPGTNISGGVAVVLQQANRLLERGYDVKILSQDGKTVLDWFPNQRVPVIPFRKDFLFLLGEVDILIATGWTTAPFLEEISAKRKVYFVQSDERRFSSSDVFLIEETYKMDVEFMTEAKWIQRWLKEEFGKDAYYVPNGLDGKIFFREEGMRRSALANQETTSSADCHPSVEGNDSDESSMRRVLLEGPIDCWFKGMQDAYDAVKDLDCEIWIVSSNGKPKVDWRYDRFFENVPYNKMREIYSSCDVFLKMSRIEGFFGPPMEAMACGCAVVVSEVTGFDEYIVDGENALVVPFGDLVGARKAVQRLLGEDLLREKLIENGKKTALEWNWNRSLDLLEKVISGEDPQVFYTEDLPRRYDFKKEMERLNNAKLKMKN